MNFIRPFLDIAVMTFILYKAYDFISKTNGVQMLKSLLIVVIVYGLAVLLKLQTILWLMNIIAPALVIGFALIFQPEIRKLFIRTDLLTAGVLSNLRQVTEYAARHESRFVKLLIQQNEIGGKRKTAAATKQLEQAQTRIAEVNRIIKRLYEDNVSGKISDERFMELSADYEQEQRELKDRAAALQEELSKSQAATVNAEKFMGIVRKHLAFEELTPTLLREMIEKIVVHECSYDENGTRRQDIEIYYSFVGKIDLPEA